MNETSKKENVQQYFEDIGKPVDQNFVMGYIKPKASTYLMWGALSALKTKSFIVGFFPEEVIFVGINMKGDFSNEHFSIPIEEIDSIEVKNRLIQYKIVLTSNGEKMPVKCSKKILGMPWQKENMTYLESVDWYRPAIG